MKRFFAILTIIILLCSSCSTAVVESESYSVSETTSVEAVSETEETKLAPILPDKTYDGTSYRIWHRDSEIPRADLYAEGLNGDVLNDIVYTRNIDTEIKFDIDIEITFTTGDAIGDSPYVSLMAGDDSYETVILYGRNMWKYATNNLILEWNTSLPYINTDMPWWSADAVENLTVDGKLFGGVGDISWNTLGSAFILMFNCKMFENLSLEPPYEAVRNGTWTFDKFSEIVKNNTLDINGNGTMDDGDQYGWRGHEWITPINYIYSADIRICKMDNGIPYIDLDMERLSSVTESYLDLMKAANVSMVAWQKYNDNCKQLFMADQILFIDNTLSGVSDLRDMDSDYGIIPIPKYTEEIPRYYSVVDAGMNIYVVPSTVKNTEMVSSVLEFMAYYGYEKITPVYYNTVLSVKLARDEESIEMLKIVRDSMVFDFGYWGGSNTFMNIGYDLINNKKEPSSYFAQRESAAVAELDEFVAKIREASK